MRRGFTLVEIMIVVAIIALLAAIAIPNLLRARVNANETAAIAAMRTISTALESYRAAQPTPSYPDALADLSSATPPYIDSTLSGAVDAATARQGYYYTYVQSSANQYTLNAAPAVPNTTGTRYFFVDESGVIRSDTAAADATSDPIQ